MFTLGRSRQTALAAAFGAVIVLGALLPARATIVTQTLTGTLAGGNDNVGVFGAPNPDLTGTPFSIVYTLNTSIGDYNVIPAQDRLGHTQFETLTKDLLVNPASPITTVLTINGVSLSISGNSILFGSGLAGNPATYSTADTGAGFGMDGQADVFNQDLFELNARGNPCVINCTTLVDSFISTSVTFGLPDYIFDPPFPGLLSSSFQGPATGTGQFLFEDIPIIKQNVFGDPDVQVSAVFNFETFSQSEVQQVPEPASWTLCLMGIMALGMATGIARRRSAEADRLLVCPSR